MREASVKEIATDGHSRSEGDESLSDLESLQHMIEESAHYLPAQGPITVFIHHNTLHAFEDLPFHEAVVKGSKIFGCQPYLSADRYRQELAKGRIRTVDLVAVLREELGASADEQVLPFCTRIDLRLAMLRYPIRLAPAAELRWHVAETDALTRFRADAVRAVRDCFVEETRHWIMRDIRDGHGPQGNERQDKRIRDALAGLFQHFGESSIERWSDQKWEAFALQALWRICRDGVHGLKLPSETAPASRRHRDLLLEATGEDSDLLVHDILIRFCAAFLDQGVARWSLPHREDGFFQAFCSFYRQPGGPPDVWLRGLRRELARLQDGHVEPLESIQESLDLLGVSAGERQEFITSTLLALRGWGGMIRQMETRTDRAAHPAPAGSVIGFLAARLVLERFALAHIARESLEFHDSLPALRGVARAAAAKHEGVGLDQRAFLIHRLAQVLGWLPSELHRLDKEQWALLVAEIETFSIMDRRRVFHEAYERHYRTQTLDALAAHSKSRTKRVANPRFQAVFCIDEREESFARHLTELAPDVETFNMAGFFAVAMYYKGAAEANFVPLCPIVIRPRHWIAEEVAYSLEEVHRRRAKTRRALGTASRQLHVGSRTFAVGAFLTASLGLLASIPLVARVLFPRLTARIRRRFGTLVEHPPVTQLQLERQGTTASPDNRLMGYSLDEMVAIADRVLGDLGLTSGFARLVLILGHGSSSLNNPHNSAYNCGACGGGAGAPNARACALILNDPRVRKRLAEKGVIIPEETAFLGGYHNTCDDSVTFLDLDRLPKSHRRDFEEAREILDRTCDRNAHERCRRFQSAPLTMSFAAARRHVEERSEDLAQTRPELGHATNALLIVGRRSRTRGLYMDRRAFLNSYDPTQDDADHSILTRILQAAIPVCAGINLEYYFSHVDSMGWGCGSKLPHNVTSLLGVMDGAASDLRTGLPWQMVEIHEPVRLMVIVENTSQAMLKIMERNAGIERLCRNGWIQLATMDPDSAQIQLFRNGRFEVYQPTTSELPKVATSTDWYRGWREHLGFAVIAEQ